MQIAVMYLVRGKDANMLAAVGRFVASYRKFSAGIDHRLYIIFKGFDYWQEEEEAAHLLAPLTTNFFRTSDDAFDLGAYADLCEKIDDDLICCFNGFAEILTAEWLRKLFVNLCLPDVGFVSSTGSFESLAEYDRRFPVFPNIHLRSNAFLIRRSYYLEVMRSRPYIKREAWLIESGAHGFSRHIISKGLDLLIVGSDGRGYSPNWWPASETFRQGDQQNLMVHDNVTRAYAEAPRAAQDLLALKTWGRRLIGGVLY